MKFRTIVLALAALALAVPAFGQNKPPASGSGSGGTHAQVITVADAISIWNAINALDNHQVVDKNGNQVTTTNNFEYSGAVHLAFARDGAKAYMIVKEYNEELAKLRAKFDEEKKAKFGDAKDAKIKEQLAEFTQQKQKDFDKRSAEMLAAPVSDVTFIHIKTDDLCLDVKPPACPVKNAIPIGILTALLPILDDK